ncbi:UNVERIFIED_CONTAM: hypothetical protein BEN50_19095 [Euhalothece sp. KZN 001]
MSMSARGGMASCRYRGSRGFDARGAGGLRDPRPQGAGMGQAGGRRMTDERKPRPSGRGAVTDRAPITPSFSLRRDGGRLVVETSHRNPVRLCQGDVTTDTAASLRALADEIEERCAQAPAPPCPE